MSNSIAIILACDGLGAASSFLSMPEVKRAGTAHLEIFASRTHQIHCGFKTLHVEREATKASLNLTISKILADFY